MSLKVEKQGKESAQSIVRRFTLKLRRSGVLFEARKRQFQTKPKSDKLKKRSALRREEKKKEYLRMKKMGELKTRK